MAPTPRAVAFRLLPVMMVLPLLVGCGRKDKQPGNDLPHAVAKDPYSLEVTLDRKKKDLHFLRDETSPLPASEKPFFQGLPYYAPDKRYAFLTVLTKRSRPADVTLATSKGKGRLLRHIGELRFSFEGIPYALQVFAPRDTTEDGDYWFVPFTDATTGTETYSGGRYLEFVPPPKDTVALDFNYAFSPYCAYNPRYDCPVPVAENRLPIAIRAGEKTWSKGRK